MGYNGRWSQDRNYPTEFPPPPRDPRTPEQRDADAESQRRRQAWLRKHPRQIPPPDMEF